VLSPCLLFLTSVALVYFVDTCVFFSFLLLRIYRGIVVLANER
jgi:hypothetical protein